MRWLGAVIAAAFTATSWTTSASAQALALRRSHCRLESLTRLPKLLLIGENHCSPHSDAVKAAAARLGAQGRLFTALEVGVNRAAYPWDGERLHRDFAVTRTPASRLYGIESPFAHGLAISYIYAIGRGHSCLQDKRTPPEKFVDYARINPHLRHAWDEARAADAEPFDAGETELARRIDAALAGTSGFVARPEDERAFVSLARRVNARYAAAANSRDREDMGRDKPLSATPLRNPSSVADLGGALNWSEALDDKEYTVLALRDRDLGENIADVYCAAAAEGRHVAASVGDDHLPGITALLAAWSGGRLPLETAHSWPTSGNLVERLISLAAEPLVERRPSIAERVERALKSLLPSDPLWAGPFDPPARSP